MEMFPDMSKYLFSATKGQDGGGVLMDGVNMLKQIKMEYLAYLGLLLTLIGISIYVYYYFVEPKLSPDYVANNEFTTTTSTIKNSKVYLYLYTVEWCPHCCKLKDEPFYKKWFGDEAVISQMDGTTWGNYEVEIKTIDGDNSDEIGKIESKFNFTPEGYPTVVLCSQDTTVFGNNKKYIELDAKIRDETLTAFLKKMLGSQN